MFKGRSAIILLFFVCLFAGALFGFIFVELSDMLQVGLAALPLREDYAALLVALEPHLSRVIVGVALIGMFSYAVARTALGMFARRLVDELMAMMRTRGFLPYTFKLARKETLRHTHENLTNLFEAYVEKLREADHDRSRYQEALERYADPTVAGAMKRQGTDGSFKSGRRQVAVLFADIRGFTPMTEALLPEEVVAILNAHFAASTTAINRHGGKVNKFIGDAVMAIFEEPPAYREGASAARNALDAAIEMQEKFAMQYRLWQEKLSNKVEFGLGVGVHTGTVILGNIGSDERTEYTAIGDTVNLSARICSLAKNGEALASEEAFEKVAAYFEATPREPVHIKGKTGLYTTYVMRHKAILQ